MRRPTPSIPAVFLGLALAGGAGAPASAGDPVEGRRIAVAHCTRCHVVGDVNPYGSIGNSPSFWWMVNKRANYKDRFGTFYARRPHPVFVRVEGVPRWSTGPAYAAEIEMTLTDVEDLLAFIDTLKEE